MIKPRHVICALGNWTSFDPIATTLKGIKSGFELNREYSILQANPKISPSFKVNQDRLPSTLDESDWNAINAHTAVAYILSPPMEMETAETISAEALKVISSLFKCGATAIQSESAGLCHGKQRWLNLASRFVEAEKSRNMFEMGATLYKTWVQRGIVDDNVLMYTIGMHLLGHRDIECHLNDEGPERAIQWADMLGHYILADRPTRDILEGDGFRLEQNSRERRIISIEKCLRRPSDSFQYNPHGYLRLNLEDKLKLL